VKLADAVAYINHDLADAVRAGVLSEGDVPAEVTAVLGRTHSERINALVLDVIDHSWAATGETAAAEGEVRIGMSPSAQAAANALREFLFRRVYLPEAGRREVEAAREVVRFLFSYYAERPQEIQSDFTVPSDAQWRQAADYIAGMTDLFALNAARRLGFLGELP
jgi:dGTPase